MSAATLARTPAPQETYEFPHVLDGIALAGQAARLARALDRGLLQADLLAAHERAVRLNTRIQHLEKRLSETLGEEVWRESGLGAPADIDALNQKIAHLEQQVTDLHLQIEERDEDLAAARAANRELMARLNAPVSSRRI